MLRCGKKTGAGWREMQFFAGKARQYCVFPRVGKRLRHNNMMHSPRFFSPQLLPGSTAVGTVIDLPEAVFRHAVKVLRLREGEELTLFDGSGGEYRARLAELGKSTASAELLDWQPTEREAPFAITLIQAVQAAEKMDWTVQKAVELGVARIQPAESRRSVVRLSGDRAAKRIEHWQGVAVAACEQCGRNRVPEVAPLLSVEQALSASAVDELKLFFSPVGAVALSELTPTARMTLLVGAEGGLDPAEEAAARVAGFVPVQLGPRVLRTETAGLAALAAIHALWGDFKTATGG